MKKILLLIVLPAIIITNTFTQQNTITILDSGHQTSLRGLSVLNNNLIWVCGSHGTVAQSTNGGRSFKWLTVKDYEQRDFRDVEGFDSNTALIMAVGEPAIILKTKNGGQSWYKVFEDSTAGMFLDAMDFDNNMGCVIGDPLDQHLFRAFSSDRGDNWIPLISRDVDDTLARGEAFFAASGTNLKIFFPAHAKQPAAFYVSGGMQANFYYNGFREPLPIAQGKETTGANSIAIFNNNTMAVVGGDFVNDKDTAGNCALSFDGGKTWQTPDSVPGGYRSCIEYISLKNMITCGTSGVDISKDSGLDWQLISTQSFNVCKKAKNGNAVFLAGANGKIGKLN